MSVTLEITYKLSFFKLEYSSVREYVPNIPEALSLTSTTTKQTNKQKTLKYFKKQVNAKALVSYCFGSWNDVA